MLDYEKPKIRGKKIASIVFGIISLLLLFALGQITLVLLAFAPSAAWMPLLPSIFFSLIGLFIGIYAKTSIGITINSLTLVVVAVFISLDFLWLFGA